MKTRNKKILIGIIAVICLILIGTIAFTTAYLTSRRKVVGYLKFASGLNIEYGNVVAASSSEWGNLQHFVNNGMEEELQDVEIEDIQPGQSIKFANPYIAPKEESASYAVRVKFIVTVDNEDEYVVPADIEQVLSTGTQSIFESGTLKVNSSFKYNALDGYYYYATNALDLENSIIKVDYDDSKEEDEQTKLYIFQSEAPNYIICEVVDGEPIEELPIKNLKLELFIEAIQYSSVSEIWFS